MHLDRLCRVGRIVISLIVFVAILDLTSFAQKKVLPPQYKFTRIDHDKGLLNATINDIIQDNVGFIWIATNDGLFKYDGLYCKAYTHSSVNPNTIPNNYVQSLFVDQQGSLWVLTDNGLCNFNYQTNTFTSFITGVTETAPSAKSVTAMMQDSKGSLLIGTYGSGIDVLQGNMITPLGQYLDKDLSALENSNISLIREQGDSVLWVGTWDFGLYRVSRKTQKISYYDHFMLGEIENLGITDLTNSADHILITTNHGLLLFDQSGRFIKAINKSNSSLEDNDILTIHQDTNSTLWLGTRNAGLYRISTNGLVDKPYYNFTNYAPSDYEDGISHRTISTIFEDRQGNIWLGTHNGGVNVFNPEGEAVSNYKHQSIEGKSLSHQSVWGIYEDKDGNLLVGTDGGGVNMLDPFQSKIVDLIQNLESTNSLSDNAILSALEDQEGNLWFGTYSGGLNKYIPQNKHFTYYINNNTSDSPLASNDVRVIKEDAYGTLWIGTNSGGLYAIKQDTGEITQISKTQGLDIRSILIDESGHLWLGTYGSALLRYDPQIEELKFYNWYNESDSNTPIILSLAKTSEYLWLGTRYSGLVRFNPKDETFQVYSESYGLTNSNIRTVVAENENRLWLSTNIGVSMFDASTEQFINFDASNGFTQGHFNDGSGLLSRFGYIAFGSIKGLNLFYPDRLLRKSAFPEVLISDISILNESIADLPGGSNNPLNKNISVAREIKLAYKQNVISFRFTALDMPNSSKWEYMYILENYEEGWNKVGRQNTATYRNLPPGEYNFKISIVGTGLSKSPPVKSILLQIASPWWATIYAYLAYAIILISVIMVIYKAHLKQVRLENSLYYEKKLRQQEHDLMEEKIRFYTNFSHELKTPLTLILGPVQDLLQTYSNIKNDSQLLKMVQKNANLLLSLINKLLEFRKIENSKVILHCAQYDISALAKEEFEYFQFQAVKKGVEIKYKSGGPLHFYFDHEKIQIVLNNLLSNAVKFTEKGQIEFCVSRENDTAIISVKDSGLGMNKKEIKSIFNPFYQANNSAGKGGTGIGLALCKNLVELHGGQITVQSTHHHGSTFTVKLPLTTHFLKAQKYVQFLQDQKKSVPIGREELLQIPAYNISSAKDNIKEKTPLMLIVDDNEDIVHYLESIFAPDYKVIASYDGKDGIKHATDLIPDIIISDVMMPQKNGIELCQELKLNQATSHIPIILLTAKDTNESKVDGFSHGADAYITKPFDSNLLKARVLNLLENRRTLANIYSKGEFQKREDPEAAFLFKVEQKVLELMDHNNDSVPKLAQELGFSRTSLYRKIKAVSGLSINQFIRQAKIKKAATMIGSGEMNVSEVAYLMGFEDLKYFRRCFKEQYGVLPSEFNKEVDQNNV